MLKEKRKKIINLALPATIENILQTSVGFVDTLMISKIGLVAVTAVGVSNSLLNVFLAVFIALGIGTSSLIAQNLGSENKEQATVVAAQSIVMASVIGIFLGAITLLWGHQLLNLMGATDEINALSTAFFYIVGGSSILIAYMTIFGSILRATGDTKTPMKISFFVNIINIIANYVLIFGLGFIPALGVTGAAIGTVFSRSVGCLLLYSAVRKSAVSFSVKQLFHKSNYTSLIRLSIPATLERLVMRFGQVLYYGLIVTLGATTFASHTIAGNIGSFAYMPAFGLATAVATLAGISIGAKRYDDLKEYTYLSVKYGVFILSGFGILLFFVCPYFALLFTGEPEAIQKVVIALRIDTFILPMLAVGLILTGALQGMGDTKSPLVSTMIGMWGIRVIGVIVFTKYFHFDIAGIWIALGIDNYMRGLYLLWKFKKNIIKLKNPSARQFPFSFFHKI